MKLLKHKNTNKIHLRVTYFEDNGDKVRVDGNVIDDLTNQNLDFISFEVSKDLFYNEWIEFKKD